jgi:hypothetical protein
MGQLLQRARRHEPLTPGERALLRLLEGLVCTALVAALPVAADALGSAGVNWADVGRAALAAAAVAVLLALAKYARAQGDPALGDALGELGEVLGEKTGGEVSVRQGSGIEGNNVEAAVTRSAADR